MDVEEKEGLPTDGSYAVITEISVPASVMRVIAPRYMLIRDCNFAHDMLIFSSEMGAPPVREERVMAKLSAANNATAIRIRKRALPLCEDFVNIRN
ncbi:MAG: hypothetical protein A3B66_01105 [Alphaproteobacteria bacterium RIFCSPHIGHO2_02_FULL_46_13]|nr:MAG: hypothetical protein A3B66_01105 [Alphaproteobacteria bacterium RIFCSPHIGHO2_02_FULL_46_13]